MKWGKIYKTLAGGLAAASLLFSGCGSKAKANQVLVSVSPSVLILLVNQSQNFTGIVTGATVTSVTWKCQFTTTTTDSTGKSTTSTPVDCVAANDGTLTNPTDTTVTYTAPAGVQNPAHTIVITATSKSDTTKSGTANIGIDSGIRVTVTPSTATVGTSEKFKFIAGVINDSNPPKGVTWAATSDTTVTTTSVTCSPGCGSVDANGVFTAPSTLPTTKIVTVYAKSVADTNRFAQATVTLVDAGANTIVFSGISPAIAPQGGLLQDVYLNVTNLRSTVQVFFDNPSNPNNEVTNQIKIINTTVTTTTGTTTTTTTTSKLAKLRLNSSQLSKPLGMYPISIRDQANHLTTFNIQLAATVPALVASSPDSFAQGASGRSFNLNGGFFGAATNPLVQVLLNGQAQGVVTTTSRQLSVPVTSQLQKAGLFPLKVANNSTGLSSGTTNVAIQPDFSGANGSPNAAKVESTGTSLTANSVPSAIALDSVSGYAAVTEQAVKKLAILKINPGTPVSTSLVTEVTVGNEPTSVAIDDQLPTHVAVVVNSTDRTLSIVDIPSGTIAETVDLTGLVTLGTGATSSTPPTPYAVGVDPFSHRAVVAYSNSNVGFVVNLDPTSGSPASCLKQPSVTSVCAISSVTLNTGPAPQIALEPGVHLAFVTPGGAGTLSVVDLTQADKQAGIADATASPAGAVRVNKSVTIKTTDALLINPAVGGTVLISGLPTGKNGTDFNGSYAVTSVPDEHTFTYFQDAVDDTGGSDATHPGKVGFSNPVLTFSVSNTIRGIAINPVSRTAIMADPNTSAAPITIVNTLDQTVSSLGLSVGSFLTTPGTAPEIGARFTAFQPFTNVAVSLNPLRNELSLIDPVTPQRLAIALGLGGSTGIGSYTLPGPGATAVQVFGGIAVDPANNVALVANAHDSTVQVVTLGTIKNLEIQQVIVPAAGSIPGALLPQATLTSASPLNTVRILGGGFTNVSQVRLDGAVIPSTFLNAQEIDVNIPASFLSAPHHYALDVVDSSSNSNAADFFVVQVVDLKPACASGKPLPAGVAIDETRNIAIVTNSGCDNVSIISLKNDATFGTPGTPISVGSSPLGVAVIPRLGFAVVANNGSAKASVINLDTKLVTANATVGTSPSGVAINPDTGQALVVNTGSNGVSAFDVTLATPVVTTAATSQNPLAVAVDPEGNNGTGIAVVTGLQLNGSFSPSGTIDVFNLNNTNGSAVPVKNTTLSIAGISATPTGVAFDQGTNSHLFYVTSSASNTVAAYNSTTGGVSSFRVGVNPTSIAYNYHSGSILSVNSASNTISIIDAQTFKTRATLAIGSSAPFAAAIYSRTNLAVIADQANNRVLLFPLPE